MEAQVLKKIVMSLTKISEQKSKKILELKKTLQTIEKENKELKKELQKISKLNEKLRTSETEQNQLKRTNQELREECKKCCNYVAHMKKRSK